MLIGYWKHKGGDHIRRSTFYQVGTIALFTTCLIGLIGITAHESAEAKAERTTEGAIPLSQFYEAETQTETITEITESTQQAEAESYFSTPIGEDFTVWLMNYCNEKGISPYLILAIIERESNYDASTVGDQGRSYGLMQIQVRFHIERMERYGYTAEDMLEAQPNVIIGVDYLQELISMDNGIEWALGAYNGGVAYSNANSPTEYAVGIIARAQELNLYD